ncbi:MAG: hypothetical protein ABEJ23_06315 [Haloarculaceae archaeon]
MDRRTLLASGAALAGTAFAGCLGDWSGASAGVAHAPAMSLRMAPATDETIADRVTYDARLDDERRRPLIDALPDGTATVQATDPPVPADRPFVYDGAVYSFSHRVVDATPATTFEVVLDPVEGTPAADETVRYESLPAVDRATFAARGWDDVSTLGFGTTVLYRDSEIPDSALVPRPDRSVIVWSDGARGRFEVRGSYDTTLSTYRYAATQVSDSAAALGADVRERHAFALTDLSPSEAGIVRTATEEPGYAVPAGEQVPAPARSLLARFRGASEVDPVWETGADDSLSGSYLVRREGDVYWTSLSVSSSVEGPGDTTTRGTSTPAPTDGASDGAGGDGTATASTASGGAGGE